MIKYYSKGYEQRLMFDKCYWLKLFFVHLIKSLSWKYREHKWYFHSSTTIAYLNYFYVVSIQTPLKVLLQDNSIDTTIFKLRKECYDFCWSKFKLCSLTLEKFGYRQFKIHRASTFGKENVFYGLLLTFKDAYTHILRRDLPSVFCCTQCAVWYFDHKQFQHQ